MNLNGDEKRIQQLFREMGDDDRLRTPGFARVVQGASSRVSPFRTGVSRRLALAFAMLCVVVITLAIVTLRRDNPVVSDEQRMAQAQPGDGVPIPVPIPLVEGSAIRPPVSVAPVKQALVHVHHRKPVSDLALAMKLSTWRSPTASLLKTTSDDKLMSLPKLGESLKTLRFYSLDDLN